MIIIYFYVIFFQMLRCYEATDVNIECNKNEDELENPYRLFYMLKQFSFVVAEILNLSIEKSLHFYQQISDLTKTQFSSMNGFISLFSQTLQIFFFFVFFNLKKRTHSSSNSALNKCKNVCDFKQYNNRLSVERDQ